MGLTHETPTKAGREAATWYRDPHGGNASGEVATATEGHRLKIYGPIAQCTEYSSSKRVVSVGVRIGLPV